MSMIICQLVATMIERSIEKTCPFDNYYSKLEPRQVLGDLEKIKKACGELLVHRSGSTLILVSVAFEVVISRRVEYTLPLFFIICLPPIIK